jgi:hypothetical protein
MSATVVQSVFWILAVGILVLFMQRRKKRKSNF